ncbi:hypothetical protein B0X71_00285 [Planococcus lenghuensis]|uniref:Uncharacterized protein n=1 Tax=Planococcus lenghuensis TaxID=2213202 RepID=A0A1Q2KUC5_9BACL|nr:hypothetical protein B0X71_00285 [Planococcus lenghuensis]
MTAEQLLIETLLSGSVFYHLLNKDSHRQYERSIVMHKTEKRHSDWNAAVNSVMTSAGFESVVRLS